MRGIVLVLLATMLAACSSARPAATVDKGTPSRAGNDISGRWIGSWRGTGLFMAPREDSVKVELVQYGDIADGRFVLEGANAAESVPVDIRYAGLWGVRVRAKVSRDKVTLRHAAGGHLFTADLKLSPDRQHMYGLIRGDHPKVALLLSREDATVPPPPQAASILPEPAPPTPQTAAPSVAMLAPEPEEPEAPAPPRAQSFEAVAELTPIHFDFDKSDLRKDAVDTLTTHVDWLKAHADTLVLIEGHCDERGTDEYNVALGERRAKSVSEMLLAHGIDADRIVTTSYGRERPVCTESGEECRMKNRRAEFRVKSR